MVIQANIMSSTVALVWKPLALFLDSVRRPFDSLTLFGSLGLPSFDLLCFTVFFQRSRMSPPRLRAWSDAYANRVLSGATAVLGAGERESRMCQPAYVIIERRLTTTLVLVCCM